MPVMIADIRLHPYHRLRGFHFGSPPSRAERDRSPMLEARPVGVLRSIPGRSVGHGQDHVAAMPATHDEIEQFDGRRGPVSSDAIEANGHEIGRGACFEKAAMFGQERCARAVARRGRKHLPH